VNQVGFIYKDIQQVDISLIAIACGGRYVIELCAEAVWSTKVCPKLF